MRKGDILLLICLLIAGGIGIVMSKWMLSGSGNQVLIKQAGKTIASYSIDKDRELDFQTEFGFNRVMIKDGKVFMESADCRDQYCVKHRPISANNDTIICLPHKLVVEIIKEVKDEEVDSIAN